MNNFVVFSVKAPAAYTVNKFFKNGIELRSVSRTKGAVIFEVAAEKEESAKRILEEEGLEYRIMRRGGSGYKFKKATKRVLFFLGIIISAVAIFLFSNLVSEVEIIGAESENDRAAVFSAIKESGLIFPFVETKKDYNDLSQKILKSDGVSGVTVRKSGVRLVINIEKELPETKVYDAQNPVPVLAEKSGIVTRIIVISGTAIVKIGDVVRKGDVLIAPYILNKDGEEVKSKAIGEVSARVWYESEKTYSDTIVTDVRTGRVESHTLIHIFGVEMSKPKTSFTSYEKEVEEIWIASSIVYGVITHNFYETEKKEIPFNFDERAHFIIEEEKEKLYQTIKNKDIPMRSWYIVKRLDKATKLSIYYEMEEKIAVC